MRKRKDTAENAATENAQQGIGDNRPAEANFLAPEAVSASKSGASAAHIDSPSLVPEVSPEITALRAAAPSGAKVAAAESPVSGDSESADAHAETGRAEQTQTQAHVHAVTSRAAAAASSRFALLAASVALAAAIGAMIGSLTTSAFTSLYAVSPVPQAAAASEETKAMTKLLTQARADIGALKASIEASNKLATTQFARISDRLERAEKSQAEPSAKITTIADTLTRVEKKLVSADVTGSIAEKPVAAVAQQKEPQRPAVVDGWYVRDIYRGHAIVESTRGGVFEVGPGSTLPGLGRVEAVRRQDGGWVVVTPKGIIVTMR